VPPWAAGFSLPKLTASTCASDTPSNARARRTASARFGPEPGCIRGHRARRVAFHHQFAVAASFDETGMCLNQRLEFWLDDVAVGQSTRCGSRPPGQQHRDRLAQIYPSHAALAGVARVGTVTSGRGRACFVFDRHIVELDARAAACSRSATRERARVACLIIKIPEITDC
jgi:hypothetical protein